MPTQLYKMPSAGIERSEREAIRHSLLTAAERADLKKVGSFQVSAMREAGVVIVFLPVLRGYLGDSIQDSRVATLTAGLYPDKTYVCTEAPKVFGKHPLINDPEVKARAMRVEQVDPSGDIIRNLSLRSAFFPHAGAYNLNSGVLWRANGRNDRIVPKHSEELDKDRVEEIHQYHMMQALWEVMYGYKEDTLPSPAIQVDEVSKNRAIQVYEQLPISQSLNVIMHPDSSSIKMDMLFHAKRWKTEKWVDLTRELTREQSDISIFLSVGADHPDVSTTVTRAANREGLPLTKLPRIPLSEYIALIDQFPKHNTVFVGLESMPAGHLAPNLGLKSVVLSDAQLYCRHYGPFGGYVVANDDPSDNEYTSRVSVEGVLEAIRKSMPARN